MGNTNSANKQIVFVAHHMPPLDAGLYSFAVTHSLTYGDESKNFVKSGSFAVAGDRFSLKNSSVHKLFPPAKSAGNYDNVLPHVVLTRRTLPWERKPADDSDSAWLALLVFTSQEAPRPTTGTLASLCPQKNGGTLEQNGYSYGSAVAAEKFLEHGETLSDPCVYLDIPLTKFASLAPALEDLAWNAHARTITSDPGTEQDFAVVVANRAPLAGSTAIVHLVSLENLGAQLPRDDGTYATQPTWDFIRLVSLQSWTFHVSPLEASFTHMLQGLNGGIDERSGELADSQLRLPAGHRPAIAPDAPLPPLAANYTVLAARDGASEPAWYRGPCVPSTVTPPGANAQWAAQLLPAAAAAELNVPVASLPAMDRSLAAAWELGRLLALADRTFATAQVTWKRDVRLSLNTKLSQANRLARGSRADYAQKMRAAIASVNDITTLLGTQLTVSPAAGKLTIPQYLVDWLGRLALLENVPVHYLLSDPLMLEPESLKFFNIDPRWLACLLDGAWSLDRQPSKQWAFDTAYQPWAQIQDGSLMTSFAADKACWPRSGVILNSQLIPAYWPGIEFVPTPNANLLREFRPGSGTLLALFDQPLTFLTVRQPPESIHFGFDANETLQFSKPLRYVSIDGKIYPPASGSPASGTPAPANYTLEKIPQRFPRLIQFDRLATALVKQLGLEDSSKFSTAEFALELVEPVAAGQFKLPEGQ